MADDSFEETEHVQSTEAGECLCRDPMEQSGMGEELLRIGQFDPEQQEGSGEPDLEVHRVANGTMLGVPERVRATSRVQAWLLRDIRL